MWRLGSLRSALGWLDQSSDSDGDAAAAARAAVDAELRELRERAQRAMPVARALQSFARPLAGVLVAVAEEASLAELQASLTELVWGTHRPFHLVARSRWCAAVAAPTSGTDACTEAAAAAASISGRPCSQQAHVVYGAAAEERAALDPIAPAAGSLDLRMTNTATGLLAANAARAGSGADGAAPVGGAPVEVGVTGHVRTAPDSGSLPLADGDSANVGAGVFPAVAVAVDVDDAGGKSKIYAVRCDAALSGMLSPAGCSLVMEMLCREFARGAESDVAIRALFEALAPNLTAVLQNLLQWPLVTGLGGTPLEGDPSLRRVVCTLPWDLVAMQATYPSLEEILTKFSQLQASPPPLPPPRPPPPRQRKALGLVGAPCRLQ